jgi:hypothetical protein
MNEKANRNRQNKKHRDAMGDPGRSATSHESQVTHYSSRVTTHQSPLTNRAFLIDIWRLETPVTPWKHTMSVRPNRHGLGAPPSAVFASGNVVSAPRRVLASRFSALGVPSLWRNPRVHREHPPGGGIEMLIPMHRSSGTVLAISTRNAYPGGAETGKLKFENGWAPATSLPVFQFPFSVFHPSFHRGET